MANGTEPPAYWLEVWGRNGWEQKTKLNAGSFEEAEKIAKKKSRTLGRVSVAEITKGGKHCVYSIFISGQPRAPQG